MVPASSSSLEPGNNVLLDISTRGHHTSHYKSWNHVTQNINLAGLLVLPTACLQALPIACLLLLIWLTTIWFPFVFTMHTFLDTPLRGRSHCHARLQDLPCLRLVCPTRHSCPLDELLLASIDLSGKLHWCMERMSAPLESKQVEQIDYAQKVNFKNLSSHKWRNASTLASQLLVQDMSWTEIIIICLLKIQLSAKNRCIV